MMIDPTPQALSIRRQCELLGLNRSSFYYQPATETEMNLQLMRLIDEQYTRTPFYGYPRMTACLRRQGYPVNRKRVARLRGVMRLSALYPNSKTSLAGAGHRVYPYLLKGLAIARPNHVWSADITYSSNEPRVYVFSRHYGLVHSLCPGLGAFEHLGRALLSGRVKAGPRMGTT
jgi:putative transposase